MNFTLRHPIPPFVANSPIVGCSRTNGEMHISPIETDLEFLYLSPSQQKASFTVPVLNLATGEATESVELKTNIFGVPVRTDLLHQMVVWHLANTRRGLANVRGHSERRDTVEVRVLPEF